LLGNVTRRDNFGEKSENQVQYTVAFGIVRRFRQSNRYSPVGATGDLDKVNYQELHQHFKEFLADRAVSGQGGENREEANKFLASEISSWEAFKTLGLAMMLWSDFIKNTDPDSEFYRDWQQIATDFMSCF
jgi:hypothetical protein